MWKLLLRDVETENPKDGEACPRTQVRSDRAEVLSQACLFVVAALNSSGIAFLRDQASLVGKIPQSLY